MGQEEVVGIPLAVIVIALVEWTKKLGLKGNWLLVASMSIGVVLGLSYKLSFHYPATPAEWFESVVYGILLGLVASGIYDVFKNTMAKL